MSIHGSQLLNLPVVQSVCAVVEVMAMMMRQSRRGRACFRECSEQGGRS
ncbi:hypothetical protein [Marinobacterium mangrovicola]|uniref:Uncharacterized protein n=1 Tax=Marinobacterium mangrovicola TaxID=1476959 RepID=A0A4R1GMI1_9GAMM|nr:hypothetical protein [Marinobacterium mangrovicola]TCK08290.1 hypothetical protein CLV83_0364 [Marinobacterium mangrovicola]